MTGSGCVKEKPPAVLGSVRSTFSVSLPAADGKSPASELEDGYPRSRTVSFVVFFF